MSNDQKFACTKVLSKALEPNETPPQICQAPPPDNPPPHDQGGAASNVTAQQLPDGTLAITIPTTVEPPPIGYPQVQCTEIWPASVPTKPQSELKCLQNLLPSCQFDHCTININTMGQTQSTN